MANKNLFSSLKNRFARANTRNAAGGRAYALDSKQALAQSAATGCFQGTFYAGAADQLANLQALAGRD